MSRPWLLALLAPLLVVSGLAGLGSVAAVLVSYHLGLCLLVPALLARHEGLSWREHARRLGLAVDPGPGAGPASNRSAGHSNRDHGRRLPLALMLGGALALAAPLSYLAAPDLFPDGDHLRAVLESWGADPDRPLPWLVFLLLANGPAEELFWRGYLQDRLVRGLRSAAALVLIFSSYHVLTVGRLAGGPGAAGLMLGAIVLAAVFWTWSRTRWETVWPAMLSHTGATAGYLAVCWHLLR